MKHVAKLLIYILRSDCLKRLVCSKTMWGMFLFLAVGMVLVYFNKLTSQSIDYLKWLGGTFFVSRGMDNLTNVTIRKE